MKGKFIFVNAETFGKIRMQLGYKPVHLGVNDYLDDDKAVITDELDYTDLFTQLIESRGNDGNK